MSQDALALFWEACGASDPLRLSIEQPGSQHPTHRDFARPFVVVGAAPQVDFPLDDEAVSQRHLYLQMIAGRVFCFDLQSRTGLRWDGRPRPCGWLDRYESLEVGPFALRLLNAAPNGASGAAHPFDPLAALPPEQDRLPGVTLEITAPGDPPASWRMNRVLAFMGRSPSCKVRVTGPGVSKFQCSLLRTPAGLWVIDLQTPEGIRVNGARVPWARLADGDELQVGHALARVRYDALSGPQPASAVSLTGTLSRLEPGTLAPRSEPMLLPPGLPGERNDWAPLLASMANQFALMQQQMFDQLTQAMMLMAQLFDQRQGSQLQVIRDELDRLHQVTRDLYALQAEAAQQPSESRQRVSSPAVEGTTRAEVEPPRGNPRAPTPLARPTGEAPEDVHAMLHERIAALQQERQGRWQTILRFLLGKSTNAPVPKAE
jgi:pSer/pThr/pTyr-binding forkhead associated (FHA) protein